MHIFLLLHHPVFSTLSRFHISNSIPFIYQMLDNHYQSMDLLAIWTDFAKINFWSSKMIKLATLTDSSSIEIQQYQKYSAVIFPQGAVYIICKPFANFCFCHYSSRRSGSPLQSLFLFHLLFWEMMKMTAMVVAEKRPFQLQPLLCLQMMMNLRKKTILDELVRFFDFQMKSPLFCLSDRPHLLPHIHPPSHVNEQEEFEISSSNGVISALSLQ